VSLTSFPDMWLTEGFAQYTSGCGPKRKAPRQRRAAFDEIYARPASNTFWPTAQAAVSGHEDLFSAPVYERGPMAWLYTPGKPAL
jgi:hypothetical protein